MSPHRLLLAVLFLTIVGVGLATGLGNWLVYAGLGVCSLALLLPDEWPRLQWIMVTVAVIFGSISIMRGY